MGSKLATCYHGIGSRVKHRRTGIDDQVHDSGDLLVWTYPAVDEVACAFPDPDPDAGFSEI